MGSSTILNTRSLPWFLYTPKTKFCWYTVYRFHPVRLSVPLNVDMILSTHVLRDGCMDILKTHHLRIAPIIFILNGQFFFILQAFLFSTGRFFITRNRLKYIFHSVNLQWGGEGIKYTLHVQQSTVVLCKCLIFFYQLELKLCIYHLIYNFEKNYFSFVIITFFIEPCVGSSHEGQL